MAVVTLLDMTDDDQRLIDAFDMLRPQLRSELLSRASVAACFAVVSRTERHDDRFAVKSPEDVTEAFLMRCMPDLPAGYADDFGFEQAYHDHALPLLRTRCISVVLGSERLDARNAATLARDLTECAIRVGPSFCAPNFADPDEGFIGATSLVEFIERWRENFGSNLARAAASPNR